jgi:hypothetical protein
VDYVEIVIARAIVFHFENATNCCNACISACISFLKIIGVRNFFDSSTDVWGLCATYFYVATREDNRSESKHTTEISQHYRFIHHAGPANNI